MQDRGVDEIELGLQKIKEVKERHQQRNAAIRYSRLKPKTSNLNTPMMRDLVPANDLAKTDLKDITKHTVHIEKDHVREELEKRLRFA